MCKKAQYYHRTNCLLFQEKIFCFYVKKPTAHSARKSGSEGAVVLMIRRIFQSSCSELLFVFVFLSAAEFESKSASAKRCNCHAYPSPDVGSITGLCIIALLGSRGIGYLLLASGVDVAFGVLVGVFVGCVVGIVVGAVVGVVVGAVVGVTVGVSVGVTVGVSVGVTVGVSVGVTVGVSVGVGVGSSADLFQVKLRS